MIKKIVNTLDDKYSDLLEDIHYEDHDWIQLKFFRPEEAEEGGVQYKLDLFYTDDKVINYEIETIRTTPVGNDYSMNRVDFVFIVGLVKALC